MKHSKRILITVLCVVILAVSWLTAVTMRSDEERQAELIAAAEAWMADEIYIRAEPLLEEAASYDTALRWKAEERLKEVYTALISQLGYARKYTTLLEQQMAREDVDPAVFREAADYYFSISRGTEALAVLRQGVETTGDKALREYYEETRYAVEENRMVYEAVSMVCGETIAVREDGLWGLARTNGELVIPCQYDAVGTYEEGGIVTMRQGTVATVDVNNNRLALYHGKATGLGPQGQQVAAVQTEQGWCLTTLELPETDYYYEQVGAFSDGLAAVCVNGKWGVINKNLEWVLPAEYESIAMDALGRSYRQGVLFVEKADGFYLHNTEQELAGPFEAVQPFLDGLAAVCVDGKWGFIDSEGTVQIDYTYEEARSFGQHLAAVKSDGLWGYISRDGVMVIEAQYLDAGYFSNGSAAVQMEDGWHFLTLTEYKEGVSI